ncbi:unnamed protein product [Ilex paraguariensis]|uniref:Uncharacterized protein n=1 Tax=Ilex paraguariensis TaxID=185542 RepID=A0ABC8QQS4_9AQUA
MGTEVEDVNVNDYGDKNIEDTIAGHGDERIAKSQHSNIVERIYIDQLIEPMGGLFDAISMHRSPIHMKVVSTQIDKIDDCGHQEEIQQLLFEKDNHLKLISELSVENDKLKEKMELGKYEKDVAMQVDMVNASSTELVSDLLEMKSKLNGRDTELREIATKIALLEQEKQKKIAKMNKLKERLEILLQEN